MLLKLAHDFPCHSYSLDGLSVVTCCFNGNANVFIVSEWRFVSINALLCHMRLIILESWYRSMHKIQHAESLVDTSKLICVLLSTFVFSFYLKLSNCDHFWMQGQGYNMQMFSNILNHSMGAIRECQFVAVGIKLTLSGGNLVAFVIEAWQKTIHQTFIFDGWHVSH